MVITAWGFAFPSPGAGDVAVIVNPQNSAVSELSFLDLVRICEQGQQYWKAGEKIYLVLQDRVGPERTTILTKVYNKSDEELKRFWLAKIFRGEITGFPKTLSSNESVKRFVAQVPNALGFVDAGVADDTVKVLRIDGKLPGEKGYALSLVK